MGIAKNKESESAMAWVISTPVSPKSPGRIRISGIKKSPLLAAEVMEDFKPCPIACSIIFVIRVKGKNGSATA